MLQALLGWGYETKNVVLNKLIIGQRKIKKIPNVNVEDLFKKETKNIIYLKPKNCWENNFTFFLSYVRRTPANRLSYIHMMTDFFLIQNRCTLQEFLKTILSICPLSRICRMREQ